MERLVRYFVPEKYRLDIAIDKSQKTIGGKVTVLGEVMAETVKLHAVDLKISSVLVNGKTAKFKTDGKTLEIFGVKAGTAELVIFYTGTLNENMQGAYLSTYEHEGRTETIVATQFESHYAREAFPCIDEPEAKAVFELAITLPKGADDLILANTEVAEVVEAAAGVTTIFQPTPRMSTYLLAWVIGRFHGRSVVNKHGVKITTYAALNQDVKSVDFANEIAAKALEFYDDNFGVKYPLTKLDQVALPDFEAGAMENWGLVTYRESMLLVGETATLSTKKSVALTVAHELSHQWFGDLVTMKWWDDLWLNESFASVMEYYAVDFIHPEYRIFEDFFVGDALAALRRDAISGVQSVHQEVSDPEEIATLFDPAIVYAKGARLMLMVIRLMGWEKFCQGIEAYFKKHAYQNTVGDDLWRALNEFAEFDALKLMHAFIERPGYPVIMGGKDSAGGRDSAGGKDDAGGRDSTGGAKIKQKRFLMDGEMTESDWPVPEVLNDMSGHYILNLSETEFDAALKQFDKLSLEEKLRLLIDRDLVSKTDLASSASLIPLVYKFRDEESAAVWSIILTIVSGLKIFFEKDTEEERAYKKFVGELVRPGLNKIGLTTRKDDDENTIRLRTILLALDFYAENKENLAKLAELYEADYTKIDAEIRADVLDAKLFLEPAFVNEYLEGYKKNADPEIKFDLLLAMTLVRDEAALDVVMGLLEQPEIVKPQDQFHLFLYLYRNPVKHAEVFTWLEGHFDYVKKMVGDKSLDNYPRYMAGSIKTEAEFGQYKKFFEPMKKDAALRRAVEMGVNEIEARLKLIKSDREAVVRELGEFRNKK